jgi:hypothetical protein
MQRRIRYSLEKVSAETGTWKKRRQRRERRERRERYQRRERKPVPSLPAFTAFQYFPTPNAMAHIQTRIDCHAGKAS